MFRRVFLIMSLLYMYRAITMYVTVLPLSSDTYVCSPKSNSTSPSLIANRVLHLMSGFGLSVNGKHTFCGDFIYSGHTVVLVFSYLMISECNYHTLNLTNCQSRVCFFQTLPKSFTCCEWSIGCIGFWA